ncbi:hypothetical protein BN2476_350202 [Paraburkholderia piptadeniae]|uniref:Uncharacterized protein n=1 Tax=Paraburkholderia piptadeniae TaxID=1701573 RepID=A0A1N7S8E9_9BURK|nr:hypothetical protein BN2476_350202 [Paraburkholderia piptadeniae]
MLQLRLQLAVLLMPDRQLGIERIRVHLSHGGAGAMHFEDQSAHVWIPETAPKLPEFVVADGRKVGWGEAHGLSKTLCFYTV